MLISHAEPTQYASNMTMPNSLDFGIEPPVAFPNVTGFEQPQLPVNQQQFGIGQQPLPVGQQQLPEFVAPSMMAPQAVQPNLGRVPIPRAGDTRLDAVLTEKSGPMSRAVAMPARRKPGKSINRQYGFDCCSPSYWPCNLGRCWPTLAILVLAEWR